MNSRFVTNLLRTPDLASARTLLLGAFPEHDLLGGLFDSAFDLTDKPIPTFRSDDPLDTLFWSAIQDHKGHRRKSLPESKSRTIGAEYDGLASRDIMDQWTALKCLCHLVAQRTQPKARVAAVVGMRDEGPTALEWIAHQRAIGVDRIFVYTNDNTDKTDELLKVLAYHQVITLIINNEMSRATWPQHKMYEHFLRLLPEAHDYDWCLFFDSDEMFVPDEKYDFDVKQLLRAADSVHHGKHGAIWFPWQWVLSGFVYSRGPDLLARRFRYSRKHHLVKSMARIRDIIDMRPIHSPTLLDDRFPVNASFERLTMDDLFKPADWPETSGKLYHYWCKSFEEFCVKKRRGDDLTLEGNAFRREMNLFFKWNGLEQPELFNPMPETVVERVQRQLAELRNLAGVEEAVQQIHAAIREQVQRENSVHLYAETMAKLR